MSPALLSQRRWAPWIGFAQDIAYSGNFAFIADGDSGLRIVDVSVPSSPQEVTFLETSEAVDVFVSGYLAYVADGT